MLSHQYAGSAAAEGYRARLSKDLSRGAVAGLLGGASIIILFLGYDALFFEPLATPEFLSSEVIDQGVFALDLSPQLRPVRIAIFTVLHLASFSVLGILLTNFLRISGAPESPLLGGLFVLTTGTLLFSMVLYLSGTKLLAEPQWPAVLLGNFVAGVVMVGYLKVREVL